MITSLYAAVLAFFFIALSTYTITGRRRYKIAMTDGAEIAMARRMRAQANFAEYTPIFLILLGLAEQAGLGAFMLHACGLVFLFGRLMHAKSLLFAEQYEGLKLLNRPVWRIRGMTLTFTVIGVLACILLLQYAMTWVV